MFVLAAIGASVIAWYLNRWILRSFLGEEGLWSFIPLIEEIAKTGFAVGFGAPILWTHGLFGLIEAGFDLRQGQPYNIPAAFLSVIGHLFYGYVVISTAVVWQGVALATIAHMAWNGVVLEAVGRLPSTR